MVRNELRISIGLSLALCLATTVWAGTDTGAKQTLTPEKTGDKQIQSKAVAPEAPAVYKPPARGKPRTRVGGGVRGGEAAPSLQVLVPEHIGQTLSDQPSLFWYVDGPPPEGTAVVFTLIDETSVEPLVEAELERPSRGGIYRIDLVEYSARLERSAEYEWSVVLIIDPMQRSKDVISSGWIDRVEAPPGFDTTGKPHSAQEYARHGLWYDALAAASDQIRADPANAALRGTRDSLLRQVGLAAR